MEGARIPCEQDANGAELCTYVATAAPQQSVRIAPRGQQQQQQSNAIEKEEPEPQEEDNDE